MPEEVKTERSKSIIPGDAARDKETGALVTVLARDHQRIRVKVLSGFVRDGRDLIGTGQTAWIGRHHFRAINKPVNIPAQSSTEEREAP